MKTLDTFRAEVFNNNPAVKAAYDDQEAEFSLVKTMIQARMNAGLTQEQVAERMGTTQSAIARIESGKTMPSMKTLTRYAKVLNMRPDVRFVPQG
jgi:DNA-binding XRE family transcriptional regulator